jgi:enolase 1/2/3
MVFRIQTIHAREVLDGRAWPTVEVEVASNDWVVTAQVPAGLSKGSHEAFELRDGGKRYGGRGVKKAVSNVNDLISPKITGRDFVSQDEIDKLLIDLDGKQPRKPMVYHCIDTWEEKMLALFQFPSLT